jgi:hypothetical protein
MQEQSRVARVFCKNIAVPDALVPERVAIVLTTWR